MAAISFSKSCIELEGRQHEKVIAANRKTTPLQLGTTRKSIDFLSENIVFYFLLPLFLSMLQAGFQLFNLAFE
jgi:hypothetical protein